MRYRFHHILPPTGFLVVPAIGYLMAEAIALWLGSYGAAHRQHVGVLICAMAAGLWGLYRVFQLHPWWRRDYGQWLQATPWNARLPLPLGPIHLVPKDAVLLAVPALASWHAMARAWSWPLVAFFGAYAACMAVTLADTGQKRFSWAILFMLGLAILTGKAGLAIPVLVGAYGIAYVGLRRSLAQFPWPGEPFLKPSNQVQSVPSKASDMKNRLGWPYSRLQPFKTEPVVSTETGLVASMLVAWFLYVIGAVGGRDSIEFMTFSYGPSVALMPLCRIGAYVSGHYPPISLLGRLYTRRLIIPGFDYVLVAPVAGWAIGALIPLVLSPLDFGAELWIPLATGAVLWVTLSWGPTLGEWRLTGHHRTVPERNAIVYAQA